MKQGVDIKLTEIHSGRCRRVVTLGINGKNPAEKFLLKLSRDDARKMDSIKARIRAVSDYDRFENDRAFKSIGGGLFEFKTQGLRLYAFYDEIEGLGHLILCTNGGKKNTRKEQQGDIARARKLKNQYETAKAADNTNLEFIEFKA